MHFMYFMVEPPRCFPAINKDLSCASSVWKDFFDRIYMIVHDEEMREEVMQDAGSQMLDTEKEFLGSV